MDASGVPRLLITSVACGVDAPEQYKSASLQLVWKDSKRGLG